MTKIKNTFNRYQEYCILNICLYEKNKIKHRYDLHYIHITINGINNNKKEENMIYHGLENSNNLDGFDTKIFLTYKRNILISSNSSSKRKVSSK